MALSLRESIKEQLNEIKKEKSKLYYCIELTFDAIKFNEHFTNYKNFWHMLTNDFFGPEEIKKSNNEWFNELQSEGFYFFTESYNLVQFRVYLEPNKKIKFEELTKRINDIVPIIEVVLYQNDEYQFNKMFANDIFKIQKSDIQYIGKVENENSENEELPF
ncbi:hypothetical protein [Flavobacterium sp.]|jgi:hypothetical protein|uniref:hypothetical protein n=1 Tax=Flavobacterium sp. TaxID=239 RepID=UPI0037BEE6B6